ncbi:MAG: DEAD/DEAH box helicase [Oligoflexia bacterium]|nr:DEAD/DEAH box helicase [Oligoflexia bacterium]
MEGFERLKLLPLILQAIRSEGYTRPTPIQEQAIPRILEGKDLLACAQTGTGKTAAFALPILQILSEAPAGAAHGTEVHPIGHSRARHREIRCLVLTPTRELASQIGESFTNYGQGLELRNTVIFGGVGQNPQVAALRKGVDIVVATPGRLLDLLEQRLIDFKHLEIFVLDEADRMLDMGFIHDVRRVIARLPKKRQTLFFSATMPSEISALAHQILTHPAKVEVTPVASTAEKIAQALFYVEENRKTPLLIHLLGDPTATRTLVFTRTKRDANHVAEALCEAGIGAAAIHGNKSQGARELALEKIKDGRARVLVATDIAARGIDIDGVTHVFNMDIPEVPENYVHRIGRTARAGKAGIAVSFCAPDEKGCLAAIERLTRKRLSVIATPTGLEPETRKRSRGRRGGQHNGRRGGRGGGQRSGRSGR